MKLIVIMVRGVCNLSQKQISTLKTLKLYRKNSLVIIPDNKPNRGLVSSLSFINWTESEEQVVSQIFKEKTHLRLNNPKKGHIYKKNGYKSFQLFKKEFIDRMYLRK